MNFQLNIVDKSTSKLDSSEFFLQEALSLISRVNLKVKIPYMIIDELSHRRCFLKLMQFYRNIIDGAAGSFL